MGLKHQQVLCFPLHLERKHPRVPAAHILTASTTMAGSMPLTIHSHHAMKTKPAAQAAQGSTKRRPDFSMAPLAPLALP